MNFLQDFLAGPLGLEDIGRTVWALPPLLEGSAPGSGREGGRSAETGQPGQRDDGRGGEAA
jgi:hypothetical protein